MQLCSLGRPGEGDWCGKDAKLDGIGLAVQGVHDGAGVLLTGQG